MTMNRTAALLNLAGALLAGNLPAAETLTEGVVTGILPHHRQRFTLTIGAASYDCADSGGAGLGDTAVVTRRDGELYATLVRRGNGPWNKSRLVRLPLRQTR